MHLRTYFIFNSYFARSLIHSCSHLFIHSLCIRTPVCWPVHLFFNSLVLSSCSFYRFHNRCLSFYFINLIIFFSQSFIYSYSHLLIIIYFLPLSYVKYCFKIDIVFLKSICKERTIGLSQLFILSDLFVFIILYELYTWRDINKNISIYFIYVDYAAHLEKQKIKNNKHGSSGS